MEALSARLLNDYQRDFPLTPTPFNRIARSLNTTTEVVLGKLRELQDKGAVSRVGPVFKPNTVGASTLAAMAVKPQWLQQVADLVSGFSEVNHNYEREHHFNLWFVVTAEDQRILAETLIRIQLTTGHTVLSLPLLRDYHIDLGFNMALDAQATLSTLNEGAHSANSREASVEDSIANAEDLIEVIQGGLPLVPRPYLEIAERLGETEDAVISQLETMITAGTIKRLGVVVRHHELGYRANAMVVWNIPDDRIDEIGRALGDQPCVTLCYQRPRRLPDWPYSLFCMVHGKDRDDVLRCIDDMTKNLSLENIAHNVLFSGRRFKQRGARYRVRN